MSRNKARKKRLRWLGVVGLVVVSGLLSQGCSLGHEEYEGTWVVTDLIPGEMPLKEDGLAGSQLGLSLTYLSDQAQLGQRHCASPSYRVSYLPARQFKQRFRVTTDTLFANRDEVKQVQVSCAENGAAFGETLLLQATGSAYTVSDGVFYKLEKADTRAG